MAASLKNAKNLQTNIFKFMNSKILLYFFQYGEIRAKCLKAFILLSEILLLDNAENIRKNFIKLSNIKEELNEISFRGLNKLLEDKK